MRPTLTLLGVTVALGGSGLFVLGLAGLGSSLTPFPAPRAGATLRQAGVYRYARHPIYGGLLTASLGWSLASAPLALLPTALLAAVLTLKARSEEQWLLARYPEYGRYRAATRARFIPLLF